jgi:hypothetical protein
MRISAGRSSGSSERMRNSPCALIVAAIAVLATPAFAEQMILCTAPGKHDIELALDAERMLDQTVSCIEIALIAHLRCAPAGGYGLAAPSGPSKGQLIRIVTKPRDYRDHVGRVTGYSIDSRQIAFSGGAMNVYGKLDSTWRFSLDRMRGKGLLTFGRDRYAAKSYGGHRVSYLCRTVEKKF